MIIHYIESNPQKAIYHIRQIDYKLVKPCLRRHGFIYVGSSINLHFDFGITTGWQ
jgi:hypothetical protein